jgi:phage shock protein PspC (stress-responsive transcriptional regulator)
MANERKLYRSQTNRMIAGVCGGIAEYFNIDPALVRILWIPFTVFGGWGFIAYIVGIFVIPLNPHALVAGQTPSGRADENLMRFIGVALVALGVGFLLDNLDFISFRSLFRFAWSYALPVSLVLVGLYLIMRPKTESRGDPPAPTEGSTATSPEPTRRRLERSATDRKLFGVCGGLGAYFSIDSTVIRLLFVLFTLMSIGFGLLLYIILIFVMPEEQPVARTVEEQSV